ncbi:hypothetical protein L9G74_16340 [Shewanella sp. C32]|uniref:Uncharacterized protein n=1 Tax=Shewanella electrica TaxID=515560 RepID=A0ABT2FNU4_9GAMM|nr:hypothetical protein [Shewanella electrica]MCH1926730.1 hypothetical protein [Shewanella electrica]MCS4558009.1 hypothetical protein [Shewanella electrica]
MNNTKWRRILTLLAEYPLYLQFKLLGEREFPLDVEQANLVLSGFGTTHFTLVRRELSYSDIGQLKIVTSPLPANTTLSQLQQALAGIAQITINPLIAVEDGYLLSGYSGI